MHLCWNVISNAFFQTCLETRCKYMSIEVRNWHVEIEFFLKKQTRERHHNDQQHSFAAYFPCQPFRRWLLLVYYIIYGSWLRLIVLRPVQLTEVEKPGLFLESELFLSLIAAKGTVGNDSKSFWGSQYVRTRPFKTPVSRVSRVECLEIRHRM